MIENFLTQAGFTMDEFSSTKLDNGFELRYPKSFLLHHGHDYEVRIKERFPELNSISRGQGDSALKLGLMQTIEEYPQFLPLEIADTFSKILKD